MWADDKGCALRVTYGWAVPWEQRGLAVGWAIIYNELILTSD